MGKIVALVDMSMLHDTPLTIKTSSDSDSEETTTTELSAEAMGVGRRTVSGTTGGLHSEMQMGGPARGGTSPPSSSEESGTRIGDRERSDLRLTTAENRWVEVEACLEAIG